MEEDRDEEESDVRDEEGTVARPVFRLPGSATLTGVVLGELGCDWANFLWAWSRGLRGRGKRRKELEMLYYVSKPVQNHSEHGTDSFNAFY